MAKKQIKFEKKHLAENTTSKDLIDYFISYDTDNSYIEISDGIVISAKTPQKALEILKKQVGKYRLLEIHTIGERKEIIEEEKK